jgi:hypothetical protein
MRISQFLVAIFMMALLTGPALGQRRMKVVPPQAADNDEFSNTSKAKGPNAQQRTRRLERQKMLVQKDVERLEVLVSQLKQDLQEAPEGTISINCLKKTEEIEKISKRLRKQLQGN